MTKKRRLYENTALLVYVLFTALFSITLFLYGFFPAKHYENDLSTIDDIPQFIGDLRLQTNVLYKPIKKRIIIMIIDAIRWDFVVGNIGKFSMPLTNSFLENSTACLLKAIVHPPTVTMPRIKAMTTGSVPNFIDVVFNLGSKPILGDNILLQAKAQGHKLIFYGDDTWLHLFPNMFDRSDGTTSFFVTDYTEVDNNVTRHISNELHNDDWSIMILHYLGLDHIGHTAGPFSPLIKHKLLEMDKIIGLIQSQIEQWNGEPSLFIVCGDHGMKDSGGHGGSTVEERTVPVIIFGANCSEQHKHATEIQQIDIVPTLSAFLGIPIPSSNLGSICLNILDDLPLFRKLFLLYYNSKQVFAHFQKLPNFKSHFAYSKYLNAVQSHITWLKSSNQSSKAAQDIILLYQTALQGMKSVLIDSRIKYDTPAMIIAIFFLYHIVCIPANKETCSTHKPKRTVLMIAGNIILYSILIYFLEAENTTVLNFDSISGFSLILLVFLILCVNCYLLSCTDYLQLLVNRITKNNVRQWIFWLVTLIHAMSLGSSSFVEEEHQTWYFFWVTFIVIVLYYHVREMFHQMSFTRTSRNYSHIQICLKLLFMLVGHRILRKLNSTGDKFAHLPDIAKTLKEQDHKIGMTVLLLTALTLLIYIDMYYHKKGQKWSSLIFNITIASCIYLRHMTDNSVINIPLYPPSRGVYAVKLFWILLIIYFVKSFYHVVITFKDDADKTSKILNFTLYVWVVVSALLHQSHNVILLPMQLLFHSLTTKIFQPFYDKEFVIYTYLCIGNVFYFYQGNSNSLATINIAAGYVGLESYKPIIAGLFLTINTYTAVILAYFMLLRNLFSEERYNLRNTLLSVCDVYVKWRLIPMAVYTSIICIQRHHLFVWTVFSPKLLYEAACSAVVCFLVLITLITMISQDIISRFI